MPPIYDNLTTESRLVHALAERMGEATRRCSRPRRTSSEEYAIAAVAVPVADRVPAALRTEGQVLVAYASPGGATERACRLALEAGKPVYTIADPRNDHLVAAGAVALPVAELVEVLSGAG